MKRSNKFLLKIQEQHNAQLDYTKCSTKSPLSLINKHANMMISRSRFYQAWVVAVFKWLNDGYFLKHMSCPSQLAIEKNYRE